MCHFRSEDVCMKIPSDTVTNSFAIEAAVGAPSPGVDHEIDDAHRYTHTGDDPRRQVGIDNGVEIVEEETSLVGDKAGAGFKVAFCQGERTGPGTYPDDDAPHECHQMQSRPHRTPAGPERTEDDKCQ